MIKRILIVDDAPVTIAMARQQIEKAGYIVDTAGNGQEGLDVLSKNDVDLIITDVVMPVMDGVDFFKALKKSEKTLSIPIIVITDSVTIEDSFRKLGVNDFIKKPLDGSILVEKIKKIERLQLGRATRGRVVIIGDDYNTVHEMGRLLEKNSCTVAVENNGIDCIPKVLRMVPQVVLVDVLLQDVPAKEIIKALKCFLKLKETAVLAFTHFSPEEMGNIDAVEQLKDSKNDCLDAGASKYIGRYSSLTLFENIRDYLRNS